MIQDRSVFDSEMQGLLAGVHDHVCSELGIAPRAEVGEDPTVTVLREVIERTLINSALAGEHDPATLLECAIAAATEGIAP